jgi:selenide,water dikinase
VLPQQTGPADPRLIVGSKTADDAGVFRLDARRALVQTVDFFTPIVDDPYTFGQIAAANALSDVYAMGGRPLTALNVMGMPEEAVSHAEIREMLRGGEAKVREAGCLVVGGHSIKNPEPVYGLSVTGLVNPLRLITNAAARAGDVLVLTKPLGTGIVTTAIKRGLCTPALAARTVSSMKMLNDVGAELGERRWVRAGTDVTGFGLLGHLGSLCRASGVGAEVDAGAVPAFSRKVKELIRDGCVPGGTKANLEACTEWTDWGAGVSDVDRLLLADAQTSGGLLVCVPRRHLDAVVQMLRSRKPGLAAVIGQITRGPQGRIRVL